MSVLLKWIINGVVIALTALVLPDVSFHGFIGPILALIVLSVLVSWVSPELIDAEKEFLLVEFFFMNYVFTVPLFFIALAATPQVDAQGFIPALIITLTSSITNSFLQFYHRKESVETGY